MATVPKGKSITIGGKTYKQGEELPERHAKLLTVPTPKQKQNESKKTS